MSLNAVTNESTPCKTSTYSIMDQSSELMFKRLHTNFMISRQAHSTRRLMLLQKMTTTKIQLNRV